MQKLIGVKRVALNDLAARGIAVTGERKGTYRLEATVTAYCAHLREQASARGGEHAVEASASHAAETRRAGRGRRGREAVDLEAAVDAQPHLEHPEPGARPVGPADVMLSQELRDALEELANA